MMGLEEFTIDDEIFVDEDVLRDGYQPKELLERDRELAEYQAALKPVIKASRPRNIFLYGQTGVGKTLATDMVMTRLQTDQQKFDHLDIKVVKIVCKSLTSSYQVSIRLVNRFRESGNKLSRRGHAPGDIYEMLWEHLDGLDATHVLFVLDEIDSIGKDDDILYELPRCNDNGNVTETKVGVIGISNDFTFRDNLSGRVSDSLCDEEIHFPPYNANQLRNILKQRSKEAFVDGVLNDDVVPLTAAFTAQGSGSARQALKLLFKAGDLARSRDLMQVGGDLVREADELIEQGKIRDELERLPTQSHLTLFSVYHLARKGETPARSSDIYEVYESAAENIDVDVRTDRTIRDRLRHLSLKGFLDVSEENKGIAGGSYYQYSLGIRKDTIVEVLATTDRFVSFF